MVLAVAQARFGPLTIQDRNNTRILTLNGQVQGGSFLAPSAEIVRPGLKGPGPVSSSAYTTAWLAAGALHPKGRMLMVGLGSGAGAVAALYNFPGLTIDVVEIDPVVVEHDMEWFPLVAHYVVEGRLNLHTGDAQEFVSTLETDYDVLCSDGYTGGSSIAVGGNAFYEAARKHCAEIWLNLIGTPNSSKMNAEFDALHAAAWSPETVYRPGTQLHTDLTRPRNWIVTSEIPDAKTLDAFLPYADLEESGDELVALRAIDEARQMWSVFMDSEMSAQDLAGIQLAIA